MLAYPNYVIEMNTIKHTLILLRFPFSIYLLPVFLFAVSQSQQINGVKALFVFFILHLLIYPSSNGYNSYMDQDTDSIGGLENPPPSTRMLLYASLLL